MATHDTEEHSLQSHAKITFTPWRGRGGVVSKQPIQRPILANDDFLLPEKSEHLRYRIDQLIKLPQLQG